MRKLSPSDDNIPRSLPAPLEGYEERIAAMNAGAPDIPEPIMMEGRPRMKETEVWEKGGAMVDLLVGQKKGDRSEMGPVEMLSSHRGYLLKQRENTIMLNAKKIEFIEERIERLKAAISERSQ